MTLIRCKPLAGLRAATTPIRFRAGKSSLSLACTPVRPQHKTKRNPRMYATERSLWLAVGRLRASIPCGAVRTTIGHAPNHPGTRNGSTISDRPDIPANPTNPANPDPSRQAYEAHAN
jgi:hypothetical protein